MLYLEHTIIALVIQAIVGLSTRNWWAGAAIATGYFLGREFAQAEYRWIEQFGGGLRANLPRWGAFDPNVWTTLDQFTDWFGPLISTAFLALLAAKRRNPPSAASEHGT